MKHYRILLFIFAAIFAPVAASAETVIVNSLPGAIADFHPVFSNNTGSVASFSINSGTGSAPFTVVVGQSYPVTKLVNGVITPIGTVSWDSAGNATYVAAP